MHAVSRLQNLRTDLRIVSSSRSFQMAYTAVFEILYVCLSLLKLVYYYSVLHINKINVKKLQSVQMLMATY